MRHTLMPLAAAALVLTACRNDAVGTPNPDAELANRPGQGIVAGDVTVQVNKAAKSLAIRNTTEQVIGYMVIEKDMMTIALFPPCGENCKQIVQGASATVQFSEIVGYTAEAREARVLWWTYTRGNDGILHPDGGVKTIAVRLD